MVVATSGVRGHGLDTYPALAHPAWEIVAVRMGWQVSVAPPTLRQDIGPHPVRVRINIAEARTPLARMFPVAVAMLDPTVVEARAVLPVPGAVEAAVRMVVGAAVAGVAPPQVRAAAVRTNRVPALFAAGTRIRKDRWEGLRR